jgi:hypothetical protein
MLSMRALLRNAATRRAFTMLALLAVMVRGVVPVGAMPAALSANGPDGSWPVVICASGFSKTIWLDENGNKVDPPPGEEAAHISSPCAFCGLTVGFPDHAPVILAAQIESTATVATPCEAPLAHAETLHLLPDSHGPPHR